MMHGSYASPCDETSTSSGRQAAWAGTGRTGVIGRCGTPADCTRQKSSAMNISRMSIAAVMGACDVGSATTCERHSGKWQHSAAKNASRCESVVPCCTCSQAAAVAEDEVGAKLPPVGLQPSPVRFRCAASQHQPTSSRGAMRLRLP